MAVIVILAIIALISTPIIIGVIEKARKGSFEDSAYGVLDAGRIYFVDKLADSNSFTGASFTFPEGGDLKISGEKPAGGTISLNENGEQALALFDKDKKWCAYKGYNDEKISIQEYKDSKCTSPVLAKMVGVVKDLSDKKNDGIIYGDSTVDKDGITFHGKGFVDAGYANYDFKEGLTFVARFKINEYVPSAVQCILGNWEGAGGGLAVSTENAPYGGLYFNGYKRIFSTKATLETYYTVVFVYDKNKLILYNNGVKVSELSVSGSPAKSPFPIYIGGNPAANGILSESSKITVTDALVMDRSLTESEIMSLFKDSVKVLKDPSVLFQYKW